RHDGRADRRRQTGRGPQEGPARPRFQGGAWARAGDRAEGLAGQEGVIEAWQGGRGEQLLSHARLLLRPLWPNSSSRLWNSPRAPIRTPTLRPRPMPRRFRRLWAAVVKPLAWVSCSERSTSSKASPSPRRG